MNANYLDVNFAKRKQRLGLIRWNDIRSSAMSVVGLGVAVLVVLVLVGYQVAIFQAGRQLYAFEAQAQKIQNDATTDKANTTRVNEELAALVRVYGVSQKNGETALQLSRLFGKINSGARVTALTLNFNGSSTRAAMDGVASTVYAADSTYRLLSHVTDYSVNQSATGFVYSIGAEAH